MRITLSNAGSSIIGVMVAMALWTHSATATAAGVLYQFNDVFSYSGSVSSPAEAAPWIDATFQDTANGVLLTVDNPGLTGGEFLSELYLNLNPVDNVKSLSFTPVSGSTGVNAPTIQTGEDAFKADGDGKYDILFTFSTSNSGRFGAGDSVTYLIAGIAGLSSLDFEYKSTPAGGHGPFYAAAHVQGIAGETGSDSVWMDPSLGPQIVPVPEPGPVAFVVMAMAVALLGATWQSRRPILSPVRIGQKAQRDRYRRMINSRSR